jgi:hypothetical protein
MLDTLTLILAVLCIEEELRLEQESLAALITQFSEWEQSQNSEITIAQRISEKNQTNKLVYTQEKIYQVKVVPFKMVSRESSARRTENVFHQNSPTMAR